MRVNCNISAIIANNQLSKSEDALSSAIERLSSGLRINKAEDDASRNGYLQEDACTDKGD